MTAQRDALIEDVEWLISDKQHPDMIAKRLGRKRTGISRTLYRAGRKDLANYFDQHVRSAA